MPIQDYAGNSSTVNISISKAQYIKLKYASHNSEVGWTVGYGNYDVAGAQAIKRNSILKTEAIAFNIEGNVDKDFLQANAYVYTHWGEGSQGKCEVPTMIYNHGYNPQKNKFKTMNSKDIVTIGENKYFQLGGPGVNFANNTDINGKNPIPANIANKYYYGVSGITLKLKDYTQFSVIYQILVDKVGWIAACSDGQECMYSKNKPMSAFRIAVIPKTEKQYIIDTWNKDIGTYNLK